ncbi:MULTISPECIES: hypothetical protein [Niastella]|uniref:Transglutaminase-like domain-containing protein n=1 Tax=Niastella soli TaxID=2821487 RepID=A0ABS3YQQ6_9BACT|nr:hypothetical protein [Niastella soli]MBO9200169.1 hypothetical protein [Niastella soli]
MEDNYENQLFKSIAGYVVEKVPESENKEEKLLLQSLHLSKYLGDTRSFIFQNKKLNSWEALIHPVTVDLMTADGACGSYAFILSYILNELKIPNRIAQMKVGNMYGGHILVEAKTSKGWVVLDGSYDLCFRKKDGGLASFSEVSNNWDYYKNQVPDSYNSGYRYEGVRYTNWDKIPVVLPLFKKVLEVFLGKERVEQISMRNYFLRKFRVLFNVSALIYLTLIIRIIIKRLKLFRMGIELYFPIMFPSLEI